MHQTPPPDAHAPNLGPGHENNTATHDDTTAAITLENNVPPSITPPRHELVVVDTATPDYQRLIDDILAQSGDDRDFEIVLLDSNADGIEQISRTLRGEAGLSAVHIISHGGDGTVQLGSAVLNIDTLIRNATQIKGWGNAFDGDADLLLYGCDVAATAEGRSLVDALGRLTGADVAASTDLTGDTRLGGNWTLEYANGSIEARTVVDAAASGTWSDVLAITANGSATSAETDNATSLTWSHTVASGSNRALFVTLAIDGVGAALQSVKYGGIDMTQVGRTAGNHAVEIWVLEAPTIGTANIVASFGGATTAAAGGAVAFNGVNQSAPTGTYAGAWAHSGSTSSVNVTSAPGELVIDAENWDGSAAGYTLGVGQSLVWSQTNTSNTGTSTTEAGAASVTMSSTVTSSAQWEIGAVSIKPVANSAPTITSDGGGAIASVNAAENQTTVTTVTATDADGDTPSFTITGGADSALFNITAGGVLTFKTAPDFETKSDNDNDGVYEVEVTADDNNGGTDSQAISVTVTDVNDAPVLDNSVNLALTSQDEDSGSPSGPIGTIVASLVDLPNSGGSTDNVTDADAGAVTGLAVTAVNTTNGSWWYTTDNGSNWYALGSVSSSNARLLAADANTRIYFQPDADYNGTVNTALTYRAWDQTSGANGGLADTTSNGGNSAFSVGEEQVDLVINPVNDAPTGSVTITGTATEDQILTADTSGISDADGLGSFSYQWLRDGVAISGATSSTHTLGDNDVGSQISVQVSYTDGNGTDEGPLISAQTSDVANVNDTPSGVPTITGTATEDQTLTADTSGISDADGLGSFSYQWLRDGVAISGATASTYTLGDNDVGTQISVQVSYTDGNGTDEGPLTSTQTAAVTNVNDNSLRRAHHLRHGHRGSDAHRRHLGYLGRRWPRKLQLPVAARWRGHLRSHRQHLHFGRQ